MGPLQGTVDDWRRDLLEQLARLEQICVPPGTRVLWFTANDEHVCRLCAARDQRSFSYAEARAELQGEFCRPAPGDRCRCSFVVDC